MSNRIDTKKVLQAVTKSRNGTTAAGAAKHFGVPKYAVYKMRRAIDVLGQAEVDSLIFSGYSITGIEKVVKGKNAREEQPLTEALIEEIESLVISQGEHAGDGFVILDWERDFTEGDSDTHFCGHDDSKGQWQDDLLRCGRCVCFLWQVITPTRGGRDCCGIFEAGQCGISACERVFAPPY